MYLGIRIGLDIELWCNRVTVGWNIRSYATTVVVVVAVVIEEKRGANKIAEKLKGSYYYKIGDSRNEVTLYYQRALHYFTSQTCINLQAVAVPDPVGVNARGNRREIKEVFSAHV